MPTTSAKSNGRLVKSEGSYYTPDAIADAMLDMLGYSGSGILDKKIIDPAAGDGALLNRTAMRYIEAGRAVGLDGAQIASGIAGNFSAYELDGAELSKCRKNICSTASSLGVNLAAKDLVHFHAGDAFSFYKQDIAHIDYVIGNPPYVRIHNLSEKPDSRYIEGMCDLYYPFFDIAQQLMKPDGRMCFIAPSSWFTSKAGRLMRQDLEGRKAIASVCDFGHYQVFAPYATAYTAIVILTPTQNEQVDVYRVDSETGSITGKDTVNQERCWISGLFLPGAPDWLSEALSAKGDIRVLNGYATNLDRVYISQTRRFPDSSIERPVVKASKCSGMHMLYPYHRDGSLMGFDEIRSDSPEAAAMLEENRHALEKRTQVDLDTWWQFGRTQGIADTFNEKVAIQSLIKPGEKVRSMTAPAGTGVYGGVYVLGMSSADVDAAINSDEFIAYASALRKYKSGGYYALGGKDIERFLNWYVRGRG